MKTVELYGRLAKKFGRSFKLDIASPVEAIQALCSQLVGFREMLQEGDYRLVRVSDKHVTGVTTDNVDMRFGSVHTLKIIPVVKGAKGGIFGWVTAVAGAFLVGAAFFLTGGVLGAAALSVFGTTITGSQLALAGGLLALSGISSILAPDIPTSPEPDKDRPSFMISSPQNLASQGHPVSWAFGRDFYIGSIVISNAIYVEDFD